MKNYLPLLLLLMGLNASSQTHIWTGAGGDTDWFNTANWDVNSVPDASSSVLIPTPLSASINASVATVNFLEIEENATLTLNSSLAVLSEMTLNEGAEFFFESGTLTGPGTIENYGHFFIFTLDNKLMDQLTLNNHNLIGVNDSGVTDLDGGMVINNMENAQIAIDSNGGWIQETGGATLNNFGSILYVDDGNAGSFYMIYDMNNHGIIEVQDQKTFLFLTIGATFHNYEDGTLTGSGAFDITANFVNEGLIAPGSNGLGTLEIVNNFSMSNTAKLVIEIEGPNPGEFDVVDVFSQPDLSGEIEIQLGNYDYSNLPATFKILTTNFGINSCNFPSQIEAMANNGIDIFVFNVLCNPDDITLELETILLGTDDRSRNATLFSIAPNPGNNQIVLATEASLLTSNSQLSLTFYNTLGQRVLMRNATSTNEMYDVSELPNGIYFLELSSNSKPLGNVKWVKF
ncbi:MAG TPA: T9SS type A sorting domain-containing protein [Flavobacteriaceae bacterium]|nr:T9SS type A sorting domain-containing protein [Flavobacteriaceae bacterium]MCB9213889.1 T9SS type A sorting domain-containing protein [Alteromonas sp.]HPF11126.1 T9SS type A sorting domain-containing protein [Flavobacteriaceae bacterium]HQU21206.1 T9SS type A sorting domain-containing protein [Flavobacteriaceae bacterium]HQU65678.1 T9SS type A sorting domain-containing protein [Flavobacteriaceae bacterium]